MTIGRGRESKESERGGNDEATKTRLGLPTPTSSSSFPLPPPPSAKARVLSASMRLPLSTPLHFTPESPQHLGTPHSSIHIHSKLLSVYAAQDELKKKKKKTVLKGLGIHPQASKVMTINIYNRKQSIKCWTWAFICTYLQTFFVRLLFLSLIGPTFH